MARLVFCALCDTTLGVLSEREAKSGSALDFLAHDDCWHVSREQILEDLDALHAGESALPVSLKRIVAGAGHLSR